MWLFNKVSRSQRNAIDADIIILSKKSLYLIQIYFTFIDYINLQTNKGICSLMLSFFPSFCIPSFLWRPLFTQLILINFINFFASFHSSNSVKNLSFTFFQFFFLARNETASTFHSFYSVSSLLLMLSKFFFQLFDFSKKNHSEK